MFVLYLITVRWRFPFFPPLCFRDWGGDILTVELVLRLIKYMFSGSIPSLVFDILLIFTECKCTIPSTVWLLPWPFLTLFGMVPGHWILLFIFLFCYPYHSVSCCFILLLPPIKNSQPEHRIFEWYVLPFFQRICKWTLYYSCAIIFSS